MWSIFSRNAFSSLSYDILDLISEDKRMIWKLHKGKRKGTEEEVSIFMCETTSNLDLAKNAIKRLKMLKHPCILKYIDALETDKVVYLITEPITPLMQWLDANVTEKSESMLVAWGLLQITKGLCFLNIDGKLIHNNVCESSIFVTHSGEWKICGMEYASNKFTQVLSSNTHSKDIPSQVIPALTCYDPPERYKRIKISHLWTSDMWGLGCLIWEVFNGQLNEADQLIDSFKIPQKLLSMYEELVNQTPSRRPSPANVLERLQKPDEYYSNSLINIISVLEEIHIKDESVKNRFFSGLTDKLDNIPKFIATKKILPALLDAHEFSNAGSIILAPLFKIGRLLEDEEYQKQIVPCVIRLFSSTDRATRLKLLQQMEALAEHLNPKTVNDQIFSPLVTGFQDTNPTIRENTVKAILFLVPKLNYNNLNMELMKHFARLQSKDDQGGIRTNTTVCLSKVAMYLHPDTRQKCLVSAFTRAMRDPFPPARTAGVTAVAATQQYFPLSEVSSKIIPALSYLTLDPDKTVRDAAFRVLKGFIGKLEKVSEDQSLQEVMEKEVTSAGASNVSTTWSGWAVGALTSKFYKGSGTVKAPVKKSEEEHSGASLTPSTRNHSVLSAAISCQEKTDIMDVKDGQDCNISMDIPDDVDADGWDDEGDWGSLDVEGDDESKMGSGLSFGSNSKASSQTEDQDDFFSAMETKFSTTNNPKHIAPVSGSSNSWGAEWDNDETLDPLSEQSSQKNDLKQQREERKLKRQKEIEAKRAGRAGAMKLGARKL